MTPNLNFNLSQTQTQTSEMYHYVLRKHDLHEYQNQNLILDIYRNVYVYLILNKPAPRTSTKHGERAVADWSDS